MFKKILQQTCYLLLIVFFNSPVLSANRGSAPARLQNSVIDIDSHLELFVDEYLIDSLINTCLVLHEPVDKGPILSFDQPWEGKFSAYGTIIESDGKYQLYYRGLNSSGADGSAEETTCYAESKDGIDWIKPNLKLFKVEGTWDNNVILAEAAPVTHNFSPFLDKRPGTDPQYKYKALGGNEKSGLIAYVSADGIRWRKWKEEAVFRKGKFDSQNVSCWSEHEKCYVCYFRAPHILYFHRRPLHAGPAGVK